MRAILLGGLLCAAASGQVCGANDLSGGYGFQLAGTTTISGTPTPMAAIGRLVFETEGRISGTSSVNFNRLFHGNPVTGTYNFQANWAIAFELQDDSGAWQHFRGELTPGGARGEFHQTDLGTGGHGVLRKLPDSCSAATLNGKYSVRLDSQRTVTVADGNGKLSWSSGDVSNSGSYEVDSDCFVQLNFGGSWRGILVDAGKTLLAVQTDPGKVAVPTFTAQ
jgi:hypothetical protein